MFLYIPRVPHCFYTFWCLNYRYWPVMGFTQDILCSLMNGYNVGSSGPTTASFVTSAYLNSFLYANQFPVGINSLFFYLGVVTFSCLINIRANVFDYI